MSDIVFLEKVIWEDDEVEFVKIMTDEYGHAKGAIFKNKDTGQKLNCTFKPHGIIEYKGD